jgi:hypothetical protein
MMSHAAVARRLGLSKPWVMYIERVALRKIALALGLPPRELPEYMRRMAGTGAGVRHCRRCGAQGHNAHGCVA